MVYVLNKKTTIIRRKEKGGRDLREEKEKKAKRGTIMTQP